jgi:hypothetical protein
VFAQRHDSAANKIWWPEIAAHGVQSDFHRGANVRVSARECKAKTRTQGGAALAPRWSLGSSRAPGPFHVKPLRPSIPDDPCNIRRKNRQCAMRRCCRTAGIC